MRIKIDSCISKRSQFNTNTETIAAIPPCPANEVIKCDGTLCQETCATTSAMQVKCNACIAAVGYKKACVCNPGYVRLFDLGPCVLASECF